MELFGRRRYVLYNFGEFNICKHNSFLLGTIQPSSPSTKEPHAASELHLMNDSCSVLVYRRIYHINMATEV